MGLLTSIFGGSSEKSSSGNKNMDLITGAYSPMMTGGIGAFNTVNNALGIGGDFGAQQEAYENFLNNSGYDYVLDQGMQGVTNSAAGNYLLRSGATAKALQDRSLNIGKTFFENYLDRLADQSRLGLGAGGLVADVGQFSKGSASSSSGGLGKAIGAGLSMLAMSDIATKDNIVDLGYDIGGVPAISFNYRQGLGLPEGEFVGVRAQDVARLRPDALGPVVDGYLTVDYGAL